ncbi:hypothetical protein [Butyrivibrio sp. WCD2001]|uniref:hypothetical protein n=1 Tax=Butyrivibrio sp. WCD2001 TaxID=1280681 RepID=UPI000425D97C|nr:hypothetical protein [Butyrivibrio sp. WCD2001]
MKRLIAMALAAVVVATSAPAVGNAANVDATVLKAESVSVQEKDQQEKFEKGEVATVKDEDVEESVQLKDGEVTVTAVKSDAKTVKIKGEVNGKPVSKISAKALKGFKGKKIVLEDVSKKTYKKLVKKLQKSAPKGVKFKRG